MPTSAPPSTNNAAIGLTATHAAVRPANLPSMKTTLSIGLTLGLAACGSSASGTTAAMTAAIANTTPPSTSTDEPLASSTSALATTPTSVATTGPTTTTSTNTSSDGKCRRLDDFDGDGPSWLIVNDGVMGGRSQGEGLIDKSTLRFFGTVVTTGGGFTSVRTLLDGTELVDTSFVRARVRLDERTYGVRLEDAQQVGGRRVSHGADFPRRSEVLTDAEGFAIVEVNYDMLSPVVFGQPVQAGSFDPAAATEFGLIIADGVDGDFTLEIDWIDACE